MGNWFAGTGCQGPVAAGALSICNSTPSPNNGIANCHPNTLSNNVQTSLLFICQTVVDVSFSPRPTTGRDSEPEGPGTRPVRRAGCPPSPPDGETQRDDGGPDPIQLNLEINMRYFRNQD